MRRPGDPVERREFTKKEPADSGNCRRVMKAKDRRNGTLARTAKYSAPGQSVKEREELSFSTGRLYIYQSFVMKRIILCK
jgi:hypothetical protein